MVGSITLWHPTGRGAVLAVAPPRRGASVRVWAVAPPFSMVSAPNIPEVTSTGLANVPFALTVPTGWSAKDQYQITTRASWAVGPVLLMVTVIPELG